jgi:hypothetical protein
MHTKAKPLSRSLGDQEPFSLTSEKIFANHKLNKRIEFHVKLAILEENRKIVGTSFEDIFF